MEGRSKAFDRVRQPEVGRAPRGMMPVLTLLTHTIASVVRSSMATGGDAAGQGNAGTAS